jgi:hypothetical protein
MLIIMNINFLNILYYNLILLKYSFHIYHFKFWSKSTKWSKQRCRFLSCNFKILWCLFWINFYILRGFFNLLVLFNHKFRICFILLILNLLKYIFKISRINIFIFYYFCFLSYFLIIKFINYFTFNIVLLYYL